MASDVRTQAVIQRWIENARQETMERKKKIAEVDANIDILMEMKEKLEAEILRIEGMASNLERFGNEIESALRDKSVDSLPCRPDNGAESDGPPIHQEAPWLRPRNLESDFSDPTMPAS